MTAKIRGNRPGPGARQTVDRNARWQCGRREPARPGKPVHRSLPWIETATSSCRGEREVGLGRRRPVFGATHGNHGAYCSFWSSKITPSRTKSARLSRVQGLSGRAGQYGGCGHRGPGGRLPDLILVDVQPPGLEGLEAVRRMRFLPGPSQVPIIVLTALATADDQEKPPEGGRLLTSRSRSYSMSFVR